MRSLVFSAPVAALLLSGCSMAPTYIRPAAPVPAEWPSGAAYPAAEAGAESGLPWQSLIENAKLRRVITQMLENNRDLRVSLANVAAARAQYRSQRSSIFPTVSATVADNATGGPRGGIDNYTANVGISAFEIDLFGRLRNQASAQFEAYLATQSGMRATKLSLVQETALAYVTLAADEDLLRIARDTEASAQRNVALNQSLLEAGLGNAVNLESARTLLAQARSDVASATTQVAQDRNALTLLVGATVETALLPTSLAEIDGTISLAPAGLSSSVLLQRPDVVEAEHRIKSANYSVGAARAAFFPTMSLTAAFGFASTTLSDLFKSDSSGWTLAPSASVPLVSGARGANLDVAKAQRDQYVAAYEKAVQSAFRDVADALARRGTVDRQRTAQAELVRSAGKSVTLSDEQYRAGTLAYINVLTAQRTLYAARQSQVAAILADLGNRLALYTAVGADSTL
jgi:multidrug efflux system outer membrane protein